MFPLCQVGLSPARIRRERHQQLPTVHLRTPPVSFSSIHDTRMPPTSQTSDCREEYQCEAASVQGDVCHAFTGQFHPAASPRAISASHIPTGSHERIDMRIRERVPRTSALLEILPSSSMHVGSGRGLIEWGGAGSPADTDK